MNIKNALLICARNFVLIWKQMVYTLIIAVVVGLCLWGTLTPVFEMLSNEGWFKLLAEYLESIYTKPSDMAVGFEMVTSRLWVLFVDNAPLLWGNYIISILLIILFHYVSNSSYTFLNLTFNNVLIESIWFLGEIGVNLFILITGYYLCKSKFSIKKIILIMCEIYFYNIIKVIIGIYFGYIDLSYDISYIFPIMTEGYWFITAYLFVPSLSTVA